MPGDTLHLVSTLDERIQWILDNCTREDGQRWNQKSLSQAAGLGDNHVGMMRRGTVKKPTADSLASIARAAKVSYRWLASGEGDPFGDASAPDATESSSPRFKNILNWRALLEMARAIAPDVPEWVWPIVAESHPLSTVPLTPALVVELARTVMRHMPPPALESTKSAKK